MGGIFGQERIDSEGQLRRAQAEAMSHSKYDEEAKARGFRSGAEMIAYLRQKEQKTGGTVAPQKGASMDSAMSWHPAVVLRKVTELMKGSR